MTLLVITPDYAVHALPLMTIAGAWHRRGQRVVVATGPAMAPLVRRAGMEYTELIMSRGSNAGVVRTTQARDEEARSLEAFFAATKRGMVETLRYQAEQRATDLLWRPVQVARRTMRIVETHEPDAIVRRSSRLRAPPSGCEPWVPSTATWSSDTPPHCLSATSSTACRRPGLLP